MRYAFVLVILVAIVLWGSTSASWAAWPADGQAICTATNDQEHVFVISDGAGGTISVWSDYRNGNWDVYAQRVDADGNPLWMSDGVPICTAPGAQLHGSASNWYTATDHVRPIAPDGMGGAIIAWHDGRGNDVDIYVQRVDHSGSVMWGANGIAIASVAGMDEVYPTLMPDGAGGVYVAWTTDYSLGADIYAQRVDANGNALWAANGIVICNAGRTQTRPEFVSDGAGGAIIMWMDYRNIGSDIYGQRVDPNGNVLWTPNGVGIRVGPGIDDSFHAVVSDGAGGAIVAFDWQPFGGHPNHRIYAQRVNGAGNLLWPAPGGVPVSTLGGSIKQMIPGIVTDGTGGAIINWWDDRNGSWDVFAQRIDPSGAAQWAVNGVPVCAASGLQGYPVNTQVWTKTVDMISDGVGGAILTWHDFRGSDGDIYVQRIDGNGAELWTRDGVAICAAVGDQTVPAIATDGAGSGIVVWQDERGADRDIYSQRIQVVQTIECPDDLFIPAFSTVESVSLVGFRIKNEDLSPMAFAYNVTSVGPLPLVDKGNPAALSGTTPVLDPGASFYPPEAALEIFGIRDHVQQIVTYHVSPVGFPDSEDSCATVATLEPPVPVLIQSFAGKAVTSGVELTWDIMSDEELGGFKIYRSLDGETSGAFINDEGLIPPESRAYIDDNIRAGQSYRYQLVVIAADGFEIISQSVAVQTQSHSFALYQNHPNPFNPTTQMRFALDHASPVTLRVYDVSGRLMRTLVDGYVPSGIHKRQWDGRDERGTRVSSGIYFYRLTAGTQTLTRKAVLLK